MERKAVSGIILILSLLGMLTLPFNVRSASTTLTVSFPVHNIDTGLDYDTIQEAIDAPETLDGNTILVDAGTYHEIITINKRLALIGEDPSTTIINGSQFNGYGETIVNINQHDASIDSFTILGDGTGVDVGIQINGIEGSTVKNCIIEKFGVGYFTLDTLDANWIVNSTISKNDVGLSTYDSTLTCFAHNFIIDNFVAGMQLIDSEFLWVYDNFFNNTVNADIISEYGPEPEFYTGFWDYVSIDCSSGPNIIGGPCIGGNYWSDYTGVDLYSGPYQNETGSDGIGDTPYPILGDTNENDYDNYPLISPFDIAITNITLSKTIVGKGYPLTINITSVNLGLYTETFNITVYANTTVIGTEEITLDSKNTTFTIFSWNTTGMDYGNYTISAVADTVPDEIDTSDNIYINGVALVTITGDIDGDGDVDRYDFGIFAQVYGTSKGDVKYLPEADLDGDEDIDRYDYGIFAQNYGKTV